MAVSFLWLPVCCYCSVMAASVVWLSVSCDFQCVVIVTVLWLSLCCGCMCILTLCLLWQSVCCDCQCFGLDVIIGCVLSLAVSWDCLCKTYLSDKIFCPWLKQVFQLLYIHTDRWHLIPYQLVRVKLCKHHWVVSNFLNICIYVSWNKTCSQWYGFNVLSNVKST